MSTFVSGIGARSVHGRNYVSSSQSEVMVELWDTPLNVDVRGQTFYDILPYRSFTAGKPTDRSESLGSTIFYLDDVKWSGNDNGVRTGVAKCMVNGLESLCEVRLSSHDKEFSLEHRYRRGYGYVSQGLLVVTMPLDAVLDIFLLGGKLIIEMAGS